MKLKWVIVVFLMKVIFFVFIYYICICSIKYNLLVGYILYVYVIIYWDINYYINFIFLFFFDLVYLLYNVYIYEIWLKSCNCILYISMVDLLFMWIGREMLDIFVFVFFRVKVFCLMIFVKFFFIFINFLVRILIFFFLILLFICEMINEKNYGIWLIIEIYWID